MKRYDPSDIEPKWQQIWTDTELYKVTEDPSRPKFYMLTEFPYPSGDGLHAGHIREYTIGDVMSRHQRMLGHNVLYPMGYDAFGLPTENYAIKHKIAPQIATERNVANFRAQFDELGYSFDWSRSVNTTDPHYYKWTQWLFLRFLEAGLAYQDEIAINWCPKEKTGLANEEVVGGVHERCGTPVEKKQLKQWLFRITDYADRLIDGLKTVDYPDKIASQQINWIGRSEGAEINFKLHGIAGQADDKHQVTVYTTRPDTIFGATFLVVAPELAQDWLNVGWQASDEVRDYVTKSIAKAELERQEDKVKTGVDTGITAVHPLSGEEIPVWVADYVLAGYGTGAIMAVPAHDERDGEFARKFDLPIITVIEPVTGIPQDDEEYRRSIVALVHNPKTNEVLSIKWGADGGDKNLFIGGGMDEGEDIVATARREVLEETGYKNLKLINQSERIHHHYVAHSKGAKKRNIDVWGVYFELENDERDSQALEADETGKFSVEWLPIAKAEQLVKDELHKYVFDKFIGHKFYTGYGPLVNSEAFDGLEGDEAKDAIVAKLVDLGVGKRAQKYKLRDWVFSRQHYWGEPIPVVHCPTDGVVPVPEDQLPVELPPVESYEPTDTGESPLAAMTDWVNVDCPKCGGPAKRETDTMPNWAGSNWYYLRYMDAHNNKAFVGADKLDYWKQVDLYLGGMEHTTLHLLYSRFCHQFLFDQGLVPTPEPYAARRGQGIVLAADGRKMSKSLGNVVNPSDIVAKYGADSLRLYVLFMAPYDEATPWSDERLGGVNRFAYRSWSLVQTLAANQAAPAGEVPDGTFEVEIDRLVHKTLKKVHDNLHDMRFNTAIAALMELLNGLSTPKANDRLLEARHAELAGRTARLLCLMLAPFAPYLAEELWHELGNEDSVHTQNWPSYDPELIKDDVVELAVQVNGKLRGTIAVATDAIEADVTAEAKANPNVAKYLEGEIVKTVYVPRRLVNFVVK